MSKMIHNIFNSKESFYVRIFQVIAFSGVLASLAGCITNAISGLPFIVTLVTWLGGVLVLLLMLLIDLMN